MERIYLKNCQIWLHEAEKVGKWPEKLGFTEPKSPIFEGLRSKKCRLPQVAGGRCSAPALALSLSRGESIMRIRATPARWDHLLSLAGKEMRVSWVPPGKRTGWSLGDDFSMGMPYEASNIVKIRGPIMALSSHKQATRKSYLTTNTAIGKVHRSRLTV